MIEDGDDWQRIMNDTYAGQTVNVSIMNAGVPETYAVTLSDKGSYYLKYYPDLYEPCKIYEPENERILVNFVMRNKIVNDPYFDYK